MKTFKNVVLLLFVAFNFQACNLFSAAGLSSQGQPTKEVTGALQKINASEVLVDHGRWDALLKKYVDKNGMVDYKGFKKDIAELNAYLQMLSEQNPNESWSVEELLAYYINTYNAYTVKLIVDNYPVKSIRDISGAWTKGIVPIGENDLSLGGIENSILRKMNEPRIHFAINCASISCPKLLNEAFTAAKIARQLDQVTKEFINSDKNEIHPQNPKLSSIFDWYRKDYIVNGEVDVIAYINRYSDIKISPDANISYKNYDWDLNEQ